MNSETQLPVGVKTIKCTVTSDKMAKSRVAELMRIVKHPRYHKYIKRRTKMMFHDQNNESKIGDIVLIKQTRPFSKRKKFDLVKIIKKTSEE